MEKYIFKRGDQAFFPHWHQKLEIIYVTDGSMQMVCNNQIFQVSKGDIVFINPFDVHSAQCNHDDVEYECIIIDTDIFISNKLDVCDKSILQLQNSACKIVSCIRDDHALASIIETVVAADQNDPYYPVTIKANLLLLLSICFQRYIRTSASLPSPHSETYALTKLLEYIHSHYNLEITSVDMAEMCGYSHAYFCRYFKSIMGKTPIEYLNTVRIKRAYEMLISTNKSITEIALAIGYSSLNYFSRQFKKVMNCTANEVKKQKADVA